MATYNFGGNTFVGCSVPLMFEDRCFLVEVESDGTLLISTVFVSEGAPVFEIVKNDPIDNPHTHVTKSGAGIVTVSDNAGGFLYKVRPGSETSVVFGTLKGEEVEGVIRDKEIRIGGSVFSSNMFVGNMVGVLVRRDGSCTPGAPIPPDLKPLLRQTFTGQDIVLSRVAIGGGIENTVFDRCNLFGPVVIMLPPPSIIRNSNLGDPRGFIWEVQSLTHQQGAIVLADCEIRFCTLHNVGLGVPLGMAADALRNLEGDSPRA